MIIVTIKKRYKYIGKCWFVLIVVASAALYTSRSVRIHALSLMVSMMNIVMMMMMRVIYSNIIIFIIIYHDGDDENNEPSFFLFVRLRTKGKKEREGSIKCTYRIHLFFFSSFFFLFFLPFIVLLLFVSFRSGFHTLLSSVRLGTA
jgi:lysylphosphatidylglycerol synthetase-like protein (DUF2156 family)